LVISSLLCCGCKQLCNSPGGMDAVAKSLKSRMTLTFAQFSNRSPRNKPKPGVIVFALCVFFCTAVPALADTVRINQVVQTISSSGRPDLKLNTLLSQDPISKATTPQGGPRNENGGSQGPKAEPIIPSVTVTGEGQRLGVEVIEEGEVEGTICDCGEIMIAGAAFPKWPLLFIAAVPLVFINHCDDCDTPSSSPTPTPTPPSTPTPTPTPTPEPASLLLFGAGLAAAGAGLRRRYARAKLQEQINAQEEE
jgi:PEP-CTERM motif